MLKEKSEVQYVSRMQAISRSHDNQAQSLHLLYPPLVFVLEVENTRPLILTPQGLCLVRILYRFVKVQTLMIIRFPFRNVLLQCSIA